MTEGALYFGRVMHRRLGTIRHRFAYRIFSLLVDLDALPALSARLRLFGHNLSRPVSFHDRDHGPRDGTPLRPWVECHLAAAGLDHAVGGRIELLCFPRLWGYVFNPLSIFFCYRPDGGIAAILYEVANTFGERHSYLLPVVGTGDVIEQNCAKHFYVSPFIAFDGRYRFRIVPPGERVMIGIRQDGPDGQALQAVLNGMRRPLDDRGLVRALLLYPLMTLKVTAAIRWQALRLWLKGARLHKRPAPPERQVSYGGAAEPGE
ncbi:MAG TPA: DUF1365 domain-containing protein [Aliidongia sp.]|nr:DUF1365 domain-containing protein [Aliidongia sp.]